MMPEEYNLRIMQDASNYADWQFNKIKDYLQGDTLEIGAGTGTITERLMRCREVTTITVTETNTNNLKALERFTSVKKINKNE